MTIRLLAYIPKQSENSNVFSYGEAQVTDALRFPSPFMKQTAARFGAGCLVLFLFCCHRETQQTPANFFSYQLSLSNDSLLNFETLKNNKASVFVFLAPDCPQSQSYNLTLNELHAKFGSAGVAFYGVVAGDKYDRKEIAGFITQFRIGLPIVLDPEAHLAKYLGATVTP